MKHERKIYTASIIIILLCVVALVSIWLNKDDLSAKKFNQNYLPKASGTAGRILVCTDPTEWESGYGGLIRQTLESPVPALPQPEPFFNYLFIAPPQFEDFRLFRQILVVFTLESTSAASQQLKQLLGKQALEQFVASQQKAALLIQQNRFAQGQLIAFLIGQNTKDLENYLQHASEQLLFTFEDHLCSYMGTTFTNTKAKANSIIDYIQEHFKILIPLPAHYQKVVHDKDFLWIGSLADNAYQNIWISRTPYRGSYMFDTLFIRQYRDSIGQRYLRYDPQRQGSFVQTETQLPLIQRPIRIAGLPANEYCGLWVLENRRRGGAFVAYAFRLQNYFYYIEAYVYAPSKEKLPIIRRMKGIIQAIQTHRAKQRLPLAKI